MSHTQIKNLFSEAVRSVVSDISQYTIHPDKDFTRNKKFPPDKLISFMVSAGSSSTKIELLDFFGLCADAPSASAFNQLWAKLKPEALEAVFHLFNTSIRSGEKSPGYRFFAADSSTFTFFSKPKFAPEEYCEGHSAKGFYSMHLNAFYDLQKHTYSDALIQPVHQKDEFAAFCTMVDHHLLPGGVKNVFIGDRGYSLTIIWPCFRKKPVFSFPYERCVADALRGGRPAAPAAIPVPDKKRE